MIIDVNGEKFKVGVTYGDIAASDPGNESNGAKEAAAPAPAATNGGAAFEVVGP